MTTSVADVVRVGPLIPVLAFESAEQGEGVSRALHAGGVKVLEITLRTAAGLAAQAAVAAQDWAQVTRLASAASALARSAA